MARPQTDLELTPVNLQPTIQRAGRNTVFAAPLPRLTSAQVLAKNLSQFSTVLGQFSNVQQQRAEKDAMTLTNEEVKAQMAGEGKEMGFLDKIGYEKRYNETVYSRDFEINTKPLFSQFSKDIKAQGVEKLADRVLFENYVNEGLDNIDKDIRERIKDKPFMLDIHNAMFNQARTTFFAEESERYDSRREAYLRDATIELFSTNFPDPQSLDAEETLKQTQNYIQDYDNVLQSVEPSKLKRKALISGMVENRVKALAMDGNILKAYDLIDAFQKTKINKTPIFSDKGTSLTIETLQRFVRSEEDRLIDRNSKLEDKIIKDVELMQINPMMRENRERVQSLNKSLSMLPLDSRPNFFVNPDIEFLRSLEDLDDSELRAKFPRLNTDRLRETFRSAIPDKIRFEEAKETQIIEDLLSDANPGEVFSSVRASEKELGIDMLTSDNVDLYPNMIMDTDKNTTGMKMITRVPGFREGASKMQRLLYIQAKQAFDSEMRKKAREINFNSNIPIGQKEAKLKNYGRTVAEKLLDIAEKDFREFVQGSSKQTQKQSRKSLMDGSGVLTDQDRAMIDSSLVTERDAIKTRRNEILAGDSTFPQSKNKEGKPDVSLKKNLWWWDRGSFKSDQENLDDYIQLFQNTNEARIFEGDTETVQEVFDNLISISRNIDYAPKYLEVIRSGKLFQDSGINLSGFPIGDTKASEQDIRDRRQAIGKLILESGVNEKEALVGVADFEDDDIGFPIDSIIRNNYNRMPILRISTIRAFDKNDKKAKELINKIITKNNIPVKASDFVNAQKVFFENFTGSINTQK